MKTRIITTLIGCALIWIIWGIRKPDPHQTEEIWIPASTFLLKPEDVTKENRKQASQELLKTIREQNLNVNAKRKTFSDLVHITGRPETLEILGKTLEEKTFFERTSPQPAFSKNEIFQPIAVTLILLLAVLASWKPSRIRLIIICTLTGVLLNISTTQKSNQKGTWRTISLKIEAKEDKTPEGELYPRRFLENMLRHHTAELITRSLETEGYPTFAILDNIQTGRERKRITGVGWEGETNQIMVYTQANPTEVLKIHWEIQRLLRSPVTRQAFQNSPFFQANRNEKEQKPVFGEGINPFKNPFETSGNKE